MEFLNTTRRPSNRLQRGNVLLANSLNVNTTPVQARMDAFTQVHGLYIEACNKVAEAETLERAEVERVEQLDGNLGKAIKALSAALLLDGEPPRNPFGRFADHGPITTAALPYGEAAAAVHSLVSALRRSMGLSKATLDAAAVADQAASKLEEVLPGLEMRRRFLEMARQTRDSRNAQWDTAYLSLRYLTKSLMEVRDLYVTLFAPARVVRRAKAAAKTEGNATGSEPTSGAPPDKASSEASADVGATPPKAA